MKSVILAITTSLAVASSQFVHSPPDSIFFHPVPQQHQFQPFSPVFITQGAPRPTFQTSEPVELSSTEAPSFTYKAPDRTYVAPTTSGSTILHSGDVVPILRDERHFEDDGRYTVDIETGNGIVLSNSGSPGGPEGAVSQAGEYSYTAPDGTPVHVKFVANENGFQPESDLLPVAPAFPHPIPQFVLDQIAFAAEEDAANARAEASGQRSSAIIGGQSRIYIQPQ